MKILVIGAGKMGRGAVYDLIHNSHEVESVTIADFDLAKALEITDFVGTDKVTAIQIDVANYSEVVELMKNHDSAISCVNYWYNAQLRKRRLKHRQIFAI
jgi:saccharopine dehydrogenase-like NADP-dependent oxidoreductase